MRSMVRVALTAALLVPMVAAPATAQNWRWDFGVNGGYSWYRGMLGSEETGLPDGTEADDVKFEAGWLFGSQLTFWLSPRIGIRANATFTERPVVGSNYDLLDGNTEDDNWFEDVNLWSGSGDLMIRLKTPNTEWMGSEFLPYLALGAGRKWVNPAEDNVTCQDLEEGEQWTCHPFTVADATTTGNSFAMGEGNVMMGLVGLGADWRLSPRFAVRLEASDRIYKPEVYRANPGWTNVVTLTDGDQKVSQVVHEIAGQIGLHMLFGVARPEVVAVTPAPPLPPPPPPAAPTPAPPREDRVMVCVIDPTSPNGIRMQEALFLHASGDTVVVTGGNRVPLRTAVGQIQVARTADWYVRGEPLTLTVGKHQMQYLTYQGAMQIEANRLTYLGTINGFPVYANRDEVADLNADLAELRRAQASNDLADILDERDDIRGELEDIKLLYVPLEPTGCVFQTVQMLEQVRKGKN